MLKMIIYTNSDSIGVMSIIAFRVWKYPFNFHNMLNFSQDTFWKIFNYCFFFHNRARPASKASVI